MSVSFRGLSVILQKEHLVAPTLMCADHSGLGCEELAVDRERAGVGAATADDVAAFLASRASLVDPPHVLFVSDGLEIVHDRGAALILIGRVEIAIVAVDALHVGEAGVARVLRPPTFRPVNGEP